jgi:UDP-N-acetyl-2-amino-2-deoxyglucuronate dehydrogenase
MKNFVLIGLGGYIAPRHLQAIKDIGGNLLAALDPKDSVGIIDKYFPEAHFFTEFERFDRHIEKLKREGIKIDYVTICSPNYLHDAHIRFALRIGADAICEKPLVLNPWNIEALKVLEKEYKKKVFTILQLRLHPSIIDLKKKIDAEKKTDYEIDLSYITPRGKWYFVSWKGQEEKSGGVATNIGVHFFDMLIWIFGKVKKYEVYESNQKKMKGHLELEKAKINWFLSVDKNDLPNSSEGKAYRSLIINGEEFNFSDGFADLHTKVYEDVLKDKGFRLDDVLPSIDLVHKLRNAKIKEN